MHKFWLFADPHLYVREPMPGAPPPGGQKTLLESGPILDAALEEFLAEPDCGVLLLAGDLTCDGHVAEHRALLPKLRRVQAMGKRVVLITATHDYGSHHPGDKNESGVPLLERQEGAAFRHELRELYDEFGFRDAIARYEADGGMSYVAQLTPGCRLLCLNDDGDGRAFCGYSEGQMAWILEQIARAKAEGDVLFAMTHHPSLPPSPVYPMISSRDMLGGWESCTRRLADAGLRCMFSGHSHMHNIAKITTPQGNPYWDINTASLAGYPGVFRTIEVEGRRMRVATRQVRDFAWDRGGLGVQEYLADYFDSLLRTLIESAANDIGRLADNAGGFSVEKETIYKLRLPITLAGKFVNRATLGDLGSLLLCRHKIPKCVRKTPLKALFLELVRNIYAGEERYGPGTPTGQALLAIAGRAEFLLKKKRAGGPMGSLQAFVLGLIYDDTPDDEVELEL